jgi:hypothetical protein
MPFWNPTPLDGYHDPDDREDENDEDDDAGVDDDLGNDEPIPSVIDPSPEPTTTFYHVTS